MTKEEIFEYLGITDFIQAGYTGKGVKILSGEKIHKDYEKTEKWQKIICPNGYESTSDTHGDSIMYILQDICPDATFYSYPISYSYLKGSKCLDYIYDNNINLYTQSVAHGKLSKGQEELMQKCIDNGTAFFCAAGNTYGGELRDSAKSEKFISIGAIYDNLKYAEYSAIGKELDYTMIAIYGFGTSYTTPTKVAMLGLLQSFFLAQTNQFLTYNNLLKFINDNLVDVEDKGYDTKTGYGLFRLPKPKTIDINKYIEVNNMDKLVMQIDNKEYKIDNELKMGDVASVIINSRTMVPIYLLRELGLSVEWNEKDKTITVIKE